MHETDIYLLHLQRTFKAVKAKWRNSFDIKIGYTGNLPTKRYNTIKFIYTITKFYMEAENILSSIPIWGYVSFDVLTSIQW